MMSKIFIIGVRGIPNRYGGFERLVENLAPHWAAMGHDVTVFCEASADRTEQEDLWHGVRRLFLKRRLPGSAGTILYDLDAFRLVPEGSVAFVFGYGTAIFQHILKRKNIRHAVNMDGIEWRRDKWGRLAKAWLKWNERVATSLSTLLIADHPEIQRSLHDRYGVASEMIAYGVTPSLPSVSTADGHIQAKYLDAPFFLIIARPEPENQIHVILDAYRQSGTTIPLLIIGNFSQNDYGRQLIRDFPEANFAGAIYDSSFLDLLRSKAQYYMHGHTVGGTNPSLIEAMAAGALVVAHDNVFNRWVLGDGGLYFQSITQLADIFAALPGDAQRRTLCQAALSRCTADFLWGHILQQYDGILARLVQPGD